MPHLFYPLFCTLFSNKMEILHIIMDCCCCCVYTEDNSWSQPEVSGSPPSSRHGHVSVTVGTDIYIHGGMAGTDMFDDLYKFNTGMKIKEKRSMMCYCISPLS